MELRPRVLLVIGCAICLAGAGLAPLPARGGVPRSCIHPRANPLECPRDTRLVTLDVLPLARVKALRQQRRQRRRVAPYEDRRRNQILEDIRDELR